MNTKQAWEGSRAKQVYEYLCDYYMEWGIMPSYRNVALAFNTSTSVYTHYLRRMEEMGLIEWRYKHPGSKYRDIMLVGALHLPPPTITMSKDALDEINRQLDKWVNQLKIIRDGGLPPNVIYPKAQNNPTQTKEQNP